MRRDVELIRKLILAVEESPSARAPRDLTIEGYTDEEVGYHAYLIGQQGLAVVANNSTRGNKLSAIILNLTAAGHDFADASRNATVWNTVIATLKDKAITAPISIIQAMLEQVMRGMVCL